MPTFISTTDVRSPFCGSETSSKRRLFTLKTPRVPSPLWEVEGTRCEHRTWHRALPPAMRGHGEPDCETMKSLWYQAVSRIFPLPSTVIALMYSSCCRASRMALPLRRSHTFTAPPSSPVAKMWLSMGSTQLRAELQRSRPHTPTVTAPRATLWALPARPRAVWPNRGREGDNVPTVLPGMSPCVHLLVGLGEARFQPSLLRCQDVDGLVLGHSEKLWRAALVLPRPASPGATPRPPHSLCPSWENATSRHDLR